MIMRFLPLSLFFLLSLAACQKHKEATKAGTDLPSETVAVQVKPVVLSTEPVYEPVVGTVKPKLKATISSDISGRILEFRVVSGQKVKKGDLIATIDSQELSASKERVEASLNQLKSELARQKKLLASHATSKSRFEQVRASEQMARASLAKINATLKKAKVLAPFSGVVTRTLADTGDLAIPGKPLIQLEDPTRLRLETPVAESLAGKLQLGDAISVEVEAVNLCMIGKVGELEPSADSVSRTFLVKINLPNSSEIRVGQFGRAWIPRGREEKLLVPASAVVKRGQMEIVFVVVDGVAQLRLVKTVPNSETQSEVLSGLAEGDQVVLVPPVSLVDGAPVTINSVQ